MLAEQPLAINSLALAKPQKLAIKEMV